VSHTFVVILFPPHTNTHTLNSHTHSHTHTHVVSQKFMQTHEDINCACRYQYAAKVQAEIDVENHAVFFDKEGILRDFSVNVLQDDARRCCHGVPMTEV